MREVEIQVGRKYRLDQAISITVMKLVIQKIEKRGKREGLNFGKKGLN